MKFIVSFLFILLCNSIGGVPIDTPAIEERNIFVIRCPDGWGYRTFRGKNGLIGVMWPAGTSFNLSETAVFVFLQNNNEPLPKIPANINLFREKCTKANFKFAKKTEEENLTMSLGEKYFTGRCGRTMIVLKETVENYNIIIAIVSAGYITKSQLAEVKEAADSYKSEIEKHIAMFKKESKKTDT